MTSTGAPSGTAPSATARGVTGDPVWQAFWLLRIGFTAAPILFGLDKFAGRLATARTRERPGHR